MSWIISFPPFRQSSVFPTRVLSASSADTWRCRLRLRVPAGSTSLRSYSTESSARDTKGVAETTGDRSRSAERSNCLRSHPFTTPHPSTFDNGSCLESSKCGGVVWSVLLISEGLRKHERWLPGMKYLGISKVVYMCPKSPMDFFPPRSHHATQAKPDIQAYSDFTMYVQKSTVFGLCSRGG